MAKHTWIAGEIITKERLEELIGEYGESYYPLDKKDYIGKQGFDCSGLTYWTYYTVTGINIGYSTMEQKEILNDYKVSMDKLQPGDLIFTTRHVVMYIGKGKVIHSASRSPYPVGGVKIDSLLYFKKGQAYRPIDYINNVFVNSIDRVFGDTIDYKKFNVFGSGAFKTKDAVMVLGG